MSTPKQLTLGRPRINPNLSTKRNFEHLHSVLEAMGYPAAASDARPAGAGVSYFAGATVDVELTETLKDTDTTGVYCASAKVLDESGVQTTVEPTVVTVCDRGGRWSTASVGDIGKAQQRLLDGSIVWDLVSLRESKSLYLWYVVDSTGGTTI